MDTEANYKSALAQVDALSDADEGTPEFDRLDVLVTFIESYEAKHYPTLKPGERVSVIGGDAGVGKDLPARLVLK